MSARLKIDEDLPREVAELLNSRGYEAATVLEQGWRGIPDEMLWRRVQAEKRWLVTADKGFADLRLYAPGSHHGVVLLRTTEESRRHYAELMSAALDELDFDELAGAVVVVTQRGIRIRRAVNF
ncbi:MAG TPA: DUF5615 family PIN-like protein [Stellaceae bacterium]|nr:DUF5615 family PIN-like protein [Stellaceae bacterium]